jgi:hypothetical protein
LATTGVLVGFGSISLTALPAAADGDPVVAAALTYTAVGHCYQTYQVPAGVTKLEVDAIGSPGQDGGGTTQNIVENGTFVPGGAGGLGSHVVATVTVTPGSTLYLNVGEFGMQGGAGGEAGNLTETQYQNPTNGGAGGGAAWVTATDPTTDVSNSYTSPDTGTHPAYQGCEPTHQLVVAAGGGGGGGAGSASLSFENGGNGGSEMGAGAHPGASNASHDGGPGMPAALANSTLTQAVLGGEGGSGGYGKIEAGFPSFVAICGNGYAGWQGTFDYGGQAGFASQDPQYTSGCGATGVGGYYEGESSGGGGGGGGGYYGGGGGGGADDYRAAGGGGGAGSSYVAGAGPATVTQAAQGVTPSITITPLTSKPAFTSQASGSCTVWVSCKLPVDVTGYPLASIGYATGSDNLPDGLSLFDNQDGTAWIEGTPDPSAVGTRVVTLEAANQYGDVATQSFTITVGLGTLTQVTLNPDPLGTFILGQTPNPLVEAIAHYSSGYTQDVSDRATWSSSLPGVAAFASVKANPGSGDQQAEFDAVSAGTSTISASYEGLSASEAMPVTLGAPIHLSVTPSDAVVGIGMTQQYTATLLYPGGSSVDVTNQVVWSTATTEPGSAVATIDQSGLLTAVPTPQNARYEGYVQATFTNPDHSTISGNSSTIYASLAHPTGISITPAQPSIASGHSEQLTATGTFPGGGSEDLSSQVTWHSSNNNLAIVSSDGGLSTATNSGGGQVTVTATAPDGVVTGSAVINVLPGEPSSISVSPASPSIGLGQSEQLTAIAHYDNNVSQDVTNQVVWSTDDIGVAVVSPSGVLTGTGTVQGQLTFVRATLGTYGDGNTIVSVTLAHPTSIAISPTNATLAPQSSLNYSAIGTFPGGLTADITSDVTWSTDNAALATFGNGHLLQTSNLGGATAHVTATSGDGLVTSSTPVTVTVGNPTSISVTFGASPLGLGTTTTATAIATYANNSTADVTNAVTWTSESPAVATISASGLVTAVGTTENAQAFIDATYSWGSGHVTGSVPIYVTLAHPLSIAVIPANTNMEPGTVQDFTAMGTYPGATVVNITNNVYWTSSDGTNFSNGGSGRQFEAGNTTEVAQVIATSSDHAVSGSASVNLDGLVHVTNPTNDSTAVFASYASQPFTATGGSGSYVWTLSGAPAGISLSATTGSSVTLTGTPTTANTNPGNHITVTATDANDQFNSYFSPFNFILSVTQAPQTITLGTLPTTAISGTQITVSATGGGSSNPIRYGTTSNVCGFNNTTLVFSTHGTCTITADQNGNTTYANAPQVQYSITVTTNQILQWSNNPPSNEKPGSTQFANFVIAPGSSSPVLYAIDAASTPGACTQVPTNSTFIDVNFVHVGTCILDANEAATTGFNAAAQIQQTITIGPLSQTVSFTSSVPSAAVVGGATYIPAGTKTASGNTISFSVDTSTTNGACTISSGVVSFAHVGTCVIDMDQAAGGDYAAAASVKQSFSVGIGHQSVTFTSSAPPNAEPGDTSYIPTASSASATPVTFNVDPATTDGSCFFNGSQLTFIATYALVNTTYVPTNGHCTIDAAQAANSDYTASAVAKQTITVHPLSLAVSITDAKASTDANTQFTVTLTSGGVSSAAHEPIQVGLFATPVDGDGSSTVGIVAASDGGPPTDTLTIPQGQTSVTGYFGGSQLGAMALVAYGTGGFLGATTSNFNVIPGDVSSLSFTQEPADVVAGGTADPSSAVQVTALDAFDNPVPGAQVSLALSPSTGSITADDTETTDANGVATFSTLSFGAPGTYMLGATSGTASTGSDPFAVWATPEVTSVTPSTGSVSGGQTVTIDGAGLTGATQVAFGGSVIGTGAFTVNSDDEITATVPSSDATGQFDVVVSNPLASSATSPSDVFTYVNSGTSTIMLKAPMGSSLQGASVDLTATITGISDSASTPTGIVTFSEGLTVLGTAPLGSSTTTSADASLSLSTLAPGSHSIKASYGGDGIFDGSSTTKSITQVVIYVPTLALTSSAPLSALGSPVTFKATVARVGGSGSPAGSVRFKSGTTVLATVALSGGKASYTTAALTHGSHMVTAVYLGDANDAAVISSGLAQSVLGVTKTSVVSSKDPSIVGGTVRLTATVAGAPESFGVVTGSVTFKDGSATLGTGALSAQGKATFSTTALIVGTHLVTAVYAGSAQYHASTSAALTQKVVGVPTVALSSSSNPSAKGVSVLFTATVTRTAPLSAFPSGTITFKSGTAVLGTVVLSSKGVAKLTIKTLGVGSHMISAVYSGDALDAGATSPIVSQQVNPAI